MSNLSFLNIFLRRCISHLPEISRYRYSKAEAYVYREKVQQSSSSAKNLSARRSYALIRPRIRCRTVARESAVTLLSLSHTPCDVLSWHIRPASYPERQGIQLSGYDYAQGVSAEKKKRIPRPMRISLYQYPDMKLTNCSSV